MKQLTGATIAATGNIKRPKRTKKERINEVLKAAYRLYFRDKYTRLAIRRCLG